MSGPQSWYVRPCVSRIVDGGDESRRHVVNEHRARSAPRACGSGNTGSSRSSAREAIRERSLAPKITEGRKIVYLTSLPLSVAIADSAQPFVRK